jgi:hypothetical protein
MAKETQAQIPPNSSGPKVRTLEVTTYIDGVATTVEMQVVAIADNDGNVIDEFMDYNWQRRVIDELAALRQVLCDRLGAPFVPTQP